MKRGLERMTLAFAEALKAAAEGEVPVGAAIFDGKGRLLACAHNRMESDRDPTAHAEILVLRAACARLQAGRLEGCEIYVSLEPCPMCAAAIGFARLRRLYFAAYDPKGGGVEHGARIFQQKSAFHCPEIYGGIGEGRGREILATFFRERRQEGPKAARETPARPQSARISVSSRPPHSDHEPS